jgi:signal transduction histidine kinase
MKNFILIYLIVFSTIQIAAQTTAIDNLEIQIQNHKNEDLLRVDLLNETAYRLYSINIDKTYRYAKEAGELADKLNYKKGKAESLRIIGIRYWMKADYPRALRYYQNALKINEEIDNKKGVAKCLNNIGGVYNNKGNYDVSLKYYNRSLKLNQEIGYKRGVSTCLNNIGGIKKVLGHLELALENYQESLNINQEIDDRKGILSSLNNIANIYLEQGNNSKSLEYFNRSIEVNKAVGAKLGLCISYKGISVVYLNKNKYTQALDYADKSLKIAKELELLNYQKNLQELISKIYAATKNYKKAYEAHVLYKALNDSIFSVQNIKEITGLEYHYKYEKVKNAIESEQLKKQAIQEEKDKQYTMNRNFLIVGFIFMTLFTIIILRSFWFKRKSNIILEKQKQTIEQDNQKLKELNATKDTFFSIIAHDLRGPLGNLYHLGEVLWQEHDKIDKDKQKELLESLVEDAKKTFNLLDNLLKWASSNSGNIVYNPQNIKINKIVTENFNNYSVKAKAKNISLKNSMNETIELNADYEMVNTIIRNLISNAIKFTPEKGQIEALSRETTDKLEVGISDSGVGISPEILPKLFKIDSNISTPGTKQEEGSGLGLKLCKELIEKNMGEINVESKEGIGTTFWISFPRSVS